VKNSKFDIFKFCIPRSEFCNSQGGFTLLEVLVALALLSITMAVILQLFSANLKGIAASDDYLNAVIKAESKLRDILDDDKLTEKSLEDFTDEGYKIETVITGTADDRTENLPVTLLEINLTVRWTKGVKERALTLRTTKLVKKQI
jgi:general secretion pathway protein I